MIPIIVRIIFHNAMDVWTRDLAQTTRYVYLRYVIVSVIYYIVFSFIDHHSFLGDRP